MIHSMFYGLVVIGYLVFLAVVYAVIGTVIYELTNETWLADSAGGLAVIFVLVTTLVYLSQLK